MPEVKRPRYDAKAEWDITSPNMDNMLPFLLVSTRPEDEAVEVEYALYQRVTGLGSERLHQVRLDMLGLPDIDVNAYAGIFIAGSPYDTTTPEERKSATQKRTEHELAALIDDIIAAHTPCLTTGYGTEVAASRMGGVVSTRWAELPQMVNIVLTEEGRKDPLLADFPSEFLTYVGHHEAIEVMPDGAVLLASSMSCPVQMMRVGENFYATQFNPEVDSDVISARLNAYRDAGWGGAEDFDTLVLIAKNGEGQHQGGQILRHFAQIYG